MGKWWQQAECGPYRRNLDPELFFPGVGEPVSSEVAAACASCPVRRECLADAMTYEARYDHLSRAREPRAGIWGGFTASARRRLADGRKVYPIYTWQAYLADRARVKDTRNRKARDARTRRARASA